MPGLRLALEALEARWLLTVPNVVSLDRDQPASSSTLADHVVFRVAFSEAVSGVNGADFSIATTGTVTTDHTIEVTGSGAQYQVVVSGIQGAGTLRLDLLDDDSIVNNSAESLGGAGAANGNFSGQAYLIDQVAPFVQSINRSNPSSPNTGATSVAYAVTFSEAVLGVDPSDFVPVVSGSVTANPIVGVAGGGASYTVTVDQVHGSGTLTLNLIDDGSIRDAAGNSLTTAAMPILFATQTTLPTGAVPISLATADLNHDGHVDLIVANFLDNNVGVLLGNSDGTFQDQVTYPVGVNPSALVAADYNGDGALDLVVTNLGSNNISLLTGLGDGTFQPATALAVGVNPQSVSAADFNDDGRVDLAVSNFGGASVSVLLGDGQGGFQLQPLLPSGPSPQSVQTADFNGDGHLDLVVANFGSNNLGVFLGNGDGTFQSQATFPSGTKPRAVAADDVNGDGRPDLVVSNSGDNNVGVLIGVGDGTFFGQATYVAGTSPWAVAIADVNGDGVRDLVSGNATSNDVSVLRGNGNGTFQSAVNFAVGRNPQSLVISHASPDGKSAVVVANFLDANLGVLAGNARGDFAGQAYTIESATRLIFLAVPGQTVSGTPLGGSTGVKVAALDRFGNIVVDENSSVTLSLTGGTFVGGATTAVAPLIAGIATFNGLAIVPAGSYSLTATDAALTSSMSPNFAIVSTVVDRKLFYKGSPRYNVTNSKFPGFSDDNAIASDKVALLPDTGAATFANVSSYSGGITGVMIDLRGGGAVGLADFSFKMGNDNLPGNWTAAPAPSSITVRSGAGVGGSDRIELMWAAGTISKTWLQVTLATNSNTGLPSPDVFFFGNAVGDSGLGDTTIQAIVDSVDASGAANNPQPLFNNIPISNIYDYNRDGAVNPADESIARNNATTDSTALNFISPLVPSLVIGRQLFYKGSPRYNVTNTMFPGFSDDNAIAIDKVPLLPGSGAATFSNLSSYSGGITGVMVDLSGPGSHTSVTANDFIFRVGNDNAPSTWATAPSPIAVTVRPGAGINGSDRVELIWAAGAIKKSWLEVITLANSRTALAQSAVLPAGQADVFFFGNAVADSGLGDSTTQARVDVNDEIAARTHPAQLFTNIPISNRYDYNRDGLVDPNDEVIARNNFNTVLTVVRYLDLANPPATPEAAPLTNPASAADENQAIASALAATTLPAPTPTRARLVDAVFAGASTDHGLDARQRELDLLLVNGVGRGREVATQAPSVHRPSRGRSDMDEVDAESGLDDLIDGMVVSEYRGQ